MVFTRLKPSNGYMNAGPGQRCRAVSLAMALVALVVPGSVLWAGTTVPPPQPADVIHLGAATCASSLCHGAVQPFADSPILQNEYIIWQSDRYSDMHAKAFDKLQTEAAENMARKLGLQSASTAPECLTCHADVASEPLRGERYQLSDGVTCESCHGPAGGYIDAHVEPDKNTSDLLAMGLYPTWQPQARARLCLSCHLGGEGRRINHRIMGAGHPRLTFELDTFTYLQPHHVVDDDYVARKGEVDFVRDWAIGQGLASIQQLEWLMDRDDGWRGIFLEPALLDCLSCHQRLDADRWEPRKSNGLGPGEMRLNDANLIILRLVMLAVDPGSAKRLQQQIRALHLATTDGIEAVMTSATRLRDEARAALEVISERKFSLDDLHAILDAITRQAGTGEFSDYIAAEQAAMALVNLVLAYERSGILEKDATVTQLDRLFAVVNDPYEYSAPAFADAIRQLAQRIRTTTG